MLNLKEGQKVIVKRTPYHCFMGGITVEFVRNGVADPSENYYSYVFTNGKLEQELEADEFELVKDEQL